MTKKAIHVQRVASKADWDAFIELPWSIYQGNPNWVPPLRVAVRDLLDTRKNPFFKHATMLPLIAKRGEKVVGRAVGVIDDAYNQFQKEKTAFFGFYESFNDTDITVGLLNEVALWAKDSGMTLLRGPMSPSTNHECGLLVEGFEEDPSVMMPYHQPYYQELFDACGFTKAKDLLAYFLPTDSQFSERIFAHAERIREKSKVRLREIRMREFDREIERILEIYNDAWERNWGFVPMNEEEIRHMAKDMKAVMDPGLVFIAETTEGEPIGFSLALPDVNQAMKKIPDGKLFPTGLLKLLWHLKGPKKRRTVNRLRILTLGIKRKYRDYGVGPLLYIEYLRRAQKMGYAGGEASWILEDNTAMNRALENMAARRTKIYRIYDRPLI